MDHYLNQLILEFPNPDTLGRLIYDGALKFAGRRWHDTNVGVVTYEMADKLSLEIAAFLKENGHHHKHYLFIGDKTSVEAGVVLLGAIKAGMAIADAKIHPPLIKQNFIDNKRLLVFENNSFNDGKTVVEYRKALKQGEKALFFNIPHTCETDNAFYFFSKDESGGLQNCPVDHKKAVKQIYSAASGHNLHPYIRIVYNWFNGFPAGF